MLRSRAARTGAQAAHAGLAAARPSSCAALAPVRRSQCTLARVLEVARVGCAGGLTRSNVGRSAVMSGTANATRSTADRSMSNLTSCVLAPWRVGSHRRARPPSARWFAGTR
eukprot:6691961-Prymnesium_polylepis.1